MTTVARRGAPIAFGLALIGVSFFLSPYLLQVGFMVLLWAYMGSTWNIIGGYGGQHAFGHGMYVGGAAYTVAYLSQTHGISPWIAAVAAVAVAAAMAWFSSYVVFRRGLKGAYFILVTIALTEAMVFVVSNLEFLNRSSGMRVHFEPNSLLAMQTTEKRIWFGVVVVLNVLIMLFLSFAQKHRFFYYLQAIRDDEEAASSIGVNVFRVKVLGSTLSGALCGLAGVVWIQYYLFIEPSIFSSFVAVEIVLFVLVGGIGRVWGPLVGAALLVPASELIRGELGHFLQGADLLLYGSLMILVIMFMPGGLLAMAGRVARALRRTQTPEVTASVGRDQDPDEGASEGVCG